MTWLDLAEEQEQYARAWTLRAPFQATPRLRLAMLGDAEDAAGEARRYRTMHEAGAALHPDLAWSLSRSTA